MLSPTLSAPERRASPPERRARLVPAMRAPHANVGPAGRRWQEIRRLRRCRRLNSHRDTLCDTIRFFRCFWCEKHPAMHDHEHILTMRSPACRAWRTACDISNCASAYVVSWGSGMGRYPFFPSSLSSGSRRRQRPATFERSGALRRPRTERPACFLALPPHRSGTTTQRVGRGPALECRPHWRLADTRHYDSHKAKLCSAIAC